MPSPYTVLALLTVGPALYALLTFALRTAMRRQDGEEPSELSPMETCRLNRSIEQLAREGGE